MGNDPQFEEEDAALAGGAKAAEPSRAKGAAEMDEEAIKKEWLRAYMEALSAAGAGPGAGAGADAGAAAAAEEDEEKKREDAPAPAPAPAPAAIDDARGTSTDDLLAEAMAVGDDVGGDDEWEDVEGDDWEDA